MPRVDESTSSTPRVAVTMGDPGGIGPEVIVKSLADQTLRASAAFTIYGLDAPLRRAAQAAGIGPFWGPNREVALIEPPGIRPEDFPAADTAASGELSVRFLRMAVDAARAGRAGAIVTGPISKRAWALAGHAWPGHTEFLAEALGAKRVGMFFHAEGSASHAALNVVLATTHVPLRDVPSRLNTERVLEVIELGSEACRRLGVTAPRVAVCGLNPHAGEGGVLGDEDARGIAPAIESARSRGINATGPHPGDTVFIAAARGGFDLVVAMYHDQGLIPVKLLARDDAVNVTLGLPIVRTSPDHGTAFDIAGKNQADAGSMSAALRLAVRMAPSAASI